MVRTPFEVQLLPLPKISCYMPQLASQGLQHCQALVGLPSFVSLLYTFDYCFRCIVPGCLIVDGNFTSVLSTTCHIIHPLGLHEIIRITIDTCSNLGPR